MRFSSISPKGKIDKLNSFMAEIIKCNVSEVYSQLEKLLDALIVKKKLREYGIVEEEITLFAKSVVVNQQRLLANNYVELSEKVIEEIYRTLF